MNSELLYTTILRRLMQEDRELTLLNDTGIFYAPELYLAFILGKEIKKNDLSIFGQATEWIRETKFDSESPYDFAFKTKDKIHIFEMKLRNTVDSYTSDIEKLARLDNKYVKYFLVLVDSWEKDKENDGRICRLEKRYENLHRVVQFESFRTKQDRYIGQIYCTVGLWELKSFK